MNTRNTCLPPVISENNLYTLLSSGVVDKKNLWEVISLVFFVPNMFGVLHPVNPTAASRLSFMLFYFKRTRRAFFPTQGPTAPLFSVKTSVRIVVKWLFGIRVIVLNRIPLNEQNVLYLKKKILLLQSLFFQFIHLEKSLFMTHCLSGPGNKPISGWVEA